MSARQRAGVSPALGEALALARRLAALEEGPMRVLAAARALTGMAPARAAAVVAALLHAEGVEQRVAAAAVARALVQEGESLAYAWRAELYAIATEGGLPEVAALLVGPPARRAFVEPRDGADARLAHLTLGHKKAAARTRRDPDLLARLAAEGDPRVVRELLRNVQTTEELVVRIAARRPCRPGTLRAVAEAPRWRTRPAVALAIARNPYAEPALALELLPLIGSATLRDLAADAVVHPLVRAVADRLATRRRPAAWSGALPVPHGRG